MANVPNAVRLVTAAAVAAAVLVAPASAQTNKSGAAAKELAQLMQQGQLDSVAAAMPGTEDGFVAAMFIPGELMVVSARYAAPAILREKIMNKAYRDVYVDLNSAATPKTRIFIEDLNTDGLVAKPEDDAGFDTYEGADGRMSFDGDWKKQKISEDEYLKRFAQSDDEYAKMLDALLSQIKKPATD